MRARRKRPRPYRSQRAKSRLGSSAARRIARRAGTAGPRAPFLSRKAKEEETSMRYLSLLIVPMIAAAVSGCAGLGGPEQVNTSAPTVTYRFTNDRELREATQRATVFCQGYGKSAHLIGGSQSDLATYECI